MRILDERREALVEREMELLERLAAFLQDFGAPPTDSLRKRLGEVVRHQFETESNRSVERMREAIAPYTRFVRSEHARMTSAGEDLAALDSESRALKAEISAPGVGPKTSL